MRQDPIELKSKRSNARVRKAKLSEGNTTWPRPTNAIDAAFAELDGQLLRVEEAISEHLEEDDAPTSITPNVRIEADSQSERTTSPSELFRDISRQLDKLELQRETLSTLLRKIESGNATS